MWNVLRLNGIGGRLLQGVRSLYVGSKACVRVGNEESEWFPVRVGLRQGCVMSPWLFNLYIDGVVYSIYIPWPFPPVWGVADNTKETTKTIGVSLRSSSNALWCWAYNKE